MQKTTLSLLLVLALVLLFCGSAGAQMPAGKWWHMPAVTKKLALTDDQLKQLDEQFVQNRLKLIELKGALEKERFELQNLLEKDNLDESAAYEQFSRVQAARSKLDTERFSFLLEVRRILGLERFQRLETIVNEFREGQNKRQGQGLRPMPGSGMGQQAE
ncbi:MAG: periplasmic heavy metal sensor [Desulfocapsaceae bacterium]|nr:periplasmic heavy metal sensor [Desulfocapsaceae bacterium]